MSLCHNRDLKIRLGTDRRRFGGDVSSMEWRSGAGTGTRSYDFAYDGLGRLVSADYGEYGDHVVGYGTSYSYDNMGNLLSLSREGDIVGPFVVNDVSGGSEEMWSLLGRLHLPYIAMHTRGTPKNMQSLTDYDNVTEAVREFFVGIAAEADRHGVEDWILDPGFGFAKTVEQNWQLLREMAVLQEFGKEILVGLSRKSFLFRPLGITPADALPATQVADFIALQNGADILRVHDVAEAVRTIKLYRLFNGVNN